MSFQEFIKKLLDSFLKLNFSKNAKERNLDIDKIQSFRKYRNKIIHRKSETKDNQNKKFQNLELKQLLINYIDLVEELVISKYYDKSKYGQPLNIDF